VVYASSSSALATGSALTFDGTNLETTGRLVVRTNTSPSFAGQIGYSAFGGTYIWPKAGSDDNFSLYDGLGNSAYQIKGSYSHVWSVSNSEQMRLTSTGLGIGTSSPSAKLMVSGGTTLPLRITNTTSASNNVPWISLRQGDTSAYGADIGIDTTTGGDFYISRVVDNTISEALRIQRSTGNVGIGLTTPEAKLQVLVSPGSAGFIATDATSSDFYIVPGVSTSVCRVGPGSGAMAFYTVNTERARIDSSGNLLVGTTSAFGAGVTIVPSGTVFSSRSGEVSGIFDRLDSNGDVVHFRRQGNTVGSISVTASATAYNTSSDYRLKNTIAPMTGALAKVALLKPVTYKWNYDNSDGEGFIAHELAEVVPQCVSGEKDAVDENGNPKYQGIDTSFLVATLTAAIQEQQAIIESLKARLDAANL
jgi:hypothetical protein